jgi:hypothetical protein
MRAGPLSNSKVIELLNSSFVPVYSVNEEYAPKGSAPAEEKAERARIFKEGYQQHWSVGSVHVYVLRPDGHLFDTLHVAKAARAETLIALLEKAVAELKSASGQPIVPPAPQSHQPKCEIDSLTLHLVARSLDGRGAWSDFPVEDWIVLSDAEVKKFLAPERISTGTSWAIDREVATKLLTHFYPATENNDVSKNKFERQSLRATVVSIRDGIARARLEGEMKMEHWFYHKPDGKSVEATVVGFVDFEPGRREIHSLRIVTDEATYGGGKFAIGLRSVETKPAPPAASPNRVVPRTSSQRTALRNPDSR